MPKRGKLSQAELLVIEDSPNVGRSPDQVAALLNRSLDLVLLNWPKGSHVSETTEVVKERDLKPSERLQEELKEVKKTVTSTKSPRQRKEALFGKRKGVSIATEASSQIGDEVVKSGKKQDTASYIHKIY